MTNGSKEVTRRFLDRSKLDFVSPVLDVEGSKAWKPCKAAYQYVLDQLGMSPEQVLLCVDSSLPGHMELPQTYDAAAHSHAHVSPRACCSNAAVSPLERADSGQYE